MPTAPYERNYNGSNVTTGEYSAGSGIYPASSNIYPNQTYISQQLPMRPNDNLVATYNISDGNCNISSANPPNYDEALQKSTINEQQEKERF